jgi:outer membrane protein insertion porin family
MVWLLILFLSWSIPGRSQTRKRNAPAKHQVASSTSVRWPIQSLSVEGNRNYSREQIIAVAGLKVGQSVAKGDFEAARERLLSTDAFESVGYRFMPSPDGKGYAASIQVVEFAEVYPFRFERLDEPADQLEAWLKKSDPLFGEKIPASEKALNRYSRAIEAFLATKNRKETVIGRVTADKTEQLIIVFRPAAPPPKVAEIQFENNQVIPAKVLQNAIAGVAIGVAYSEDRFREILNNSIRPLYEQRGRIRVSFPSIQAEKAQQVDGLLVKVKVLEGDSYDLGQVQFEGEGLPEKELRQAGDFKSGDIANFTEIQAGVARIKKRLGREGFMHPEVHMARRIQDQSKKVDLIIQVEKGPQYTVGELTVKGLDIYGEAAIRRLWTLKEGTPFDAEYPDYFLQRIREDGIFDNLGKAKSVLNIDDEKRTVNVTLVFG